MTLFGCSKKAYLENNKEKQYQDFLIKGKTCQLSSLQDTLQLIKFLLSNEGNEKLNTSWFGRTREADSADIARNLCSSQTDEGIPFVSNQFAALYLISSLAHDSLNFTDNVAIYYYDSISNHLIQVRDLKLSDCKICFLKQNSFGKNQYYKATMQAILRELFILYKEWYSQVKEKGYYSVHKFPLSDSRFSWNKGSFMK